MPFLSPQRYLRDAAVDLGKVAPYFRQIHNKCVRNALQLELHCLCGASLEAAAPLPCLKLLHAQR
eukprot:2444203-Rhodomonas_salina.1